MPSPQTTPKEVPMKKSTKKAQALQPTETRNLPIAKIHHGRREGSSEAAEAFERIVRNIDPKWLSLAQEALLTAMAMAGEKGATVDDAKRLCPPPRIAHWWCAVPRSLKDSIEPVGAVRGPAAVSHNGLLRRWIIREAR